MEKSPVELYSERVKRVQDAVELRVPDRVPFLPHFSFFAARYTGMSCEDLMYDYDKLEEAHLKAVLDLQPDMYVNPYPLMALGGLMDVLGAKAFRWPGGGLDPYLPYQYVEKEYMKGEEYDDFLFDPTDFMLRIFLPRIYGALKPLQGLPYLPSVYYTRFLSATAALGEPEITEAVKALLRAGESAREMIGRAVAYNRRMKEFGFPSQFGATAYAPFDYIGDLLRGTRGIMLDIFRVPDKLIEALEKTVPIVTRGAVNAARTTGVPTVFMPLHKGIDSFMSGDQFKTFYWPTLKKVILNLIEKDLTPCVFFEGDCTSRLEIIADIPKGKAIYQFEASDIFKAKDILGDRVCIRGNVPGALLVAGTPEEVQTYCRQLIEKVGKGGGFIMDGGVGIPDEARPENVNAMAETTRVYGVY